MAASAQGYSGSGPVFVGRSAEQAELLRAWEAVSGGRARIVSVVGGSGIGKSALVHQFLRQVTPQRLAWAHGDPEERTLAWGVLGQLAAGLSAGQPPLWAGPDHEADPLLVGQSLLDDLRSAGQTMLVIDDAQWADRQSLAALGFVARRVFGCPVLLVVVHHDETGMDESWRRICDSPHSVRLRLGGLPAADLVRLATASGHFGLSPGGAARLHAHTAGNPLYARTVLEQVPMRSIVSGEGPLPAPPTIAGTVARALTALSLPAQALLCAGAVLGRDFAVRQAADLARLDEVTAALDEAVAARLGTEVPGTAGQRFAFAHSLVHQAIYGHIGLARRAELHQRAAALLGGVDALRHRVAAAGRADPGLAADLARQAALDTVHGRLAIAADRLRQALQLTPDGPGRTPLLLTVVEAALIAGDAVSVTSYAEELAAGGGDPWWDYVAGYQALLAGQVDQALERLRRALDATGEGYPLPAGAPADLRARVAAQLAIIAAVTLSYPEMIEYGQIAVAASSHDPRVTGFAWFAKTLGQGLAGQGAAALADLDTRGTPTGLDPLVARGIVKLWTDDLDGAYKHLSEALDRAYRGEALRVSQALAFLGEVEYRRGQLADSVLHTELAVGDAEENERFWDYALLRGLASYARAARGDWAEAQAHSEVAEQWAPFVGTRSGLVAAAVIKANIAQARGDTTALLAAAERIEELFDPLEPGVTLFGPLRAEALAELGQLEEAAQALDDFTSRFGAVGRRSAQLGIARVNGQIAFGRGAHAEAMAEFKTAHDLAESIGLPLEAGRIDLLAGRCLGAIGRYDAAGLRLRSALRRFTEIGAAAYLGQAHDALAVLGLSPDAPPDLLAMLTGAERRVALLVAEGLSNSEVAGRLFIQKGSVEFHLTNIYRKLGTDRTGLRGLAGHQA